MADDRLRALEARLRRSGDPADRAAYFQELRRHGLRPSTEDLAADLEERVRSGALDRERIKVAAVAGHAAARLCVSRMRLRISYPFSGSTIGTLSSAERRALACDCAERALDGVRAGDQDLAPVRAAVDVARRNARGRASRGELAAAHEEATEAREALGPKGKFSPLGIAALAVVNATRTSDEAAAKDAGHVLANAVTSRLHHRKHDEARRAQEEWVRAQTLAYLLGDVVVKRELDPRTQRAMKKAARTRAAKARAAERSRASQEPAERKTTARKTTARKTTARKATPRKAAPKATPRKTTRKAAPRR